MNVDRDSCRGYSILSNFKRHDTGACIDVTLLIKDKISDTVVDVLSMVLLHTLHGVSVVADETVGTSINELMCLHHLLYCRL